MVRDRIHRRAERLPARIAAPSRRAAARLSTRTACGSRVVVEGIDPAAFARLKAWCRRRDVSLALVVGGSDLLVPAAGGNAASRAVAMFLPIGPLARRDETRLWRLLGRSGVRIPLVRRLRGRAFSDEAELCQALEEALAERRGVPAGLPNRPSEARHPGAQRPESPLGHGGAPPRQADPEEARGHYVPINASPNWLGAPDLLSAALSCAVFTASFSLGLGFHPVAPAIGFLYGLFGRYLARLRSAIAFELGDGPLGNAAALAVDALHGVLLMGLVLNPAAGLGLGLGRVVWTSACHTLSKGALRLFLDKRFSVGTVRKQSVGVLTTTGLDFGVGLLTSLAYAGSPIALALQAVLAVAGLLLLFIGPKGAELRRLRIERRAVMV